MTHTTSRMWLSVTTYIYFVHIIPDCKLLQWFWFVGGENEVLYGGGQAHNIDGLLSNTQRNNSGAHNLVK